MRTKNYSKWVYTTLSILILLTACDTSKDSVAQASAVIRTSKIEDIRVKILDLTNDMNKNKSLAEMVNLSAVPMPKEDLETWVDGILDDRAEAWNKFGSSNSLRENLDQGEVLVQAFNKEKNDNDDKDRLLKIYNNLVKVHNQVKGLTKNLSNLNSIKFKIVNLNNDLDGLDALTLAQEFPNLAEFKREFKLFEVVAYFKVKGRVYNLKKAVLDFYDYLQSHSYIDWSSTPDPNTP